MGTVTVVFLSSTSSNQFYYDSYSSTSVIEVLNTRSVRLPQFTRCSLSSFLLRAAHHHCKKSRVSGDPKSNVFFRIKNELSISHVGMCRVIYQLRMLSMQLFLCGFWCISCVIRISTWFVGIIFPTDTK